MFSNHHLKCNEAQSYENNCKSTFITYLNKLMFGYPKKSSLEENCGEKHFFKPPLEFNGTQSYENNCKQTYLNKLTFAYFYSINTIQDKNILHDLLGFDVKSKAKKFVFISLMFPLTLQKLYVFWNILLRCIIQTLFC